MVTAPVLAAPAFAATVTTTVPDFEPFAFAGTAIQDASVFADHEQPVSVSTVNVTTPPFADTAVLAGVTS